MAHKLEYLLDFCNTDAQRRVVQMFIEGHSGPEIAEATGRGHRSGPDTMLRRIKKRAARSGQAPGHFDPDPAFDAAFDKLAKELGMKTELHLQVEERQAAQQNARAVQIGGDHYKKLAIQPFEYNTANGIGFAEGCAIKYLTRWKDKGGIEDLRKARHFIDLLIEYETANG